MTNTAQPKDDDYIVVPPYISVRWLRKQIRRGRVAPGPEIKPERRALFMSSHQRKMEFIRHTLRKKNG
jgi:hypothetical protein